MTKSQSPLLGSNRRRHHRHRPEHSSTFRSFRSAFAGHKATPPVNNGPYRKDIPISDSTARQPLSRKGLLSILLATLLIAAALPGFQFIENSEMFQLRKITVQGNRVTSEEEIVTLAGIKLGQSLLGFRTDEAEERICRHPWIDRAVIRKSWPAALHIQVEEHRPLALINLEKGSRPGLHYVDQHGTIFALADPAQDLDFPIITGLAPPDRPEKFSLADDRAAAEAMQFLRFAAQGHPMLPLQSVSEIHLSRDKGIVVYLAERPFPIYIGYGNISPGYSHLVRLLKQLYDKEGIENIREIRMDYQPGRILVARLEP